MKFIKRLLAKIRCRFDKNEWCKNYCTSDCDTCGYHK